MRLFATFYKDKKKKISETDVLGLKKNHILLQIISEEKKMKKS
jgi:hypothetical protein